MSMNGHVCLYCSGSKIELHMECVRCGHHILWGLECPMSGGLLKDCLEPKRLWEASCSHCGAEALE